MNIFKRKKPIVLDIPTIPPRPEVLKFSSIERYRLATPELSNGKVFYPISKYGYIQDYFTTMKKAEAARDKLNAVMKRESKKLIAKSTAIRNKEINDWDAKYKNKAIRVEGK